MQVSWIDPDEVRDLLKQLEGPKAASTTSAWEVHTLPTAQVAHTDAEPLIGEHSHPTPESTIAEEHAIPASAELWRIREKLRALRDKAHSAGILARNKPQNTEQEPLPSAPAEPTVPEPIEPASSPPVVVQVEEPKPIEPIIEQPLAIEVEPPPVVEPLFDSPTDVAVPVVETPLPPETIEPPIEEEPEAPMPAPPVTSHIPFIVPNQGLSERLNSVAEWVCARLATREVLLVDDYGDVLWGDHRQTALVLSAVMAWQSAQRASASATCIDPERIDKPLPPDRALTVLPLRTKYGMVSLAVILPQPVATADAADIREALAQAVEGLGA